VVIVVEGRKFLPAIKTGGILTTPVGKKELEKRMSLSLLGIILIAQTPLFFLEIYFKDLLYSFGTQTLFIGRLSQGERGIY
jgi:hypothetical protein